MLWGTECPSCPVLLAGLQKGLRGRGAVPRAMGPRCPLQEGAGSAGLGLAQALPCQTGPTVPAPPAPDAGACRCLAETCSRLGKDLLVAGGNVVDAGIAAALCLGLVHPHAGGLGECGARAKGWNCPQAGAARVTAPRMEPPGPPYPTIARAAGCDVRPGSAGGMDMAWASSQRGAWEGLPQPPRPPSRSQWVPNGTRL